MLELVITEIAYPIIQILVLLFFIDVLVRQIQARRKYGDSSCKECKTGKYFPVDNTIIAKAYICPDCGSYIFFPIDFRKTSNPVEEPEQEEDLSIEKI